VQGRAVIADQPADQLARRQATPAGGHVQSFHLSLRDEERQFQHLWIEPANVAS